ncbi:hypothetical protein D3C80_2220770 [compost metagenome]
MNFWLVSSSVMLLFSMSWMLGRNNSLDRSDSGLYIGMSISGYTMISPSASTS